MHADIDGATRIAGIAAEFDWKWPLDDPAPFWEAAGWELLRENGVMWLRTDLAMSPISGHPPKNPQSPAGSYPAASSSVR
ncbi:hypothetical protein [Nocardia noduli]|uniref:hypothetical protein n=1 Tax=Nocardia noduli TaxID=2815722 RepID=UPI001C24C381|nr:hypothetical protein [Nocardia noduli]